jgi:Lon protease-like protein
MASVIADLPLFPLHTVLFPDGLLPLKIFEARYLDMARECLREERPFGVCLLKSGDEVADPERPSIPEGVGCLAQIIGCDVQQFGMLLIRARGTQRFRLLSHRTEPNGLLCGMAEPIPADLPPDGLAHLAKLAACADVLERIIATIGERDPGNLPFLEPFLLSEPAWVSNRLAEILPIPIRARQKLMELEDAVARLDIVHHYMEQHQLL